MHDNPSNLIFAVSKALGRKLNRSRFNDRLMMQKGCYILNSWGYGPFYNFSLYIRGPYSPELADDYYEMRELDCHTSVPESDIMKLAGIMGKGVRYTEAYATVLLVKDSNPTGSNQTIFNKSLSIKPHLEFEIREACSSILT